LFLVAFFDRALHVDLMSIDRNAEIRVILFFDVIGRRQMEGFPSLTGFEFQFPNLADEIFGIIGFDRYTSCKILTDIDHISLGAQSREIFLQKD
jgi:hypothetical protein